MEGISHRSSRYRRKRLPVTVVTATSILLSLVLVFVRRVLVVVSPHIETLPISSLPQLKDVEKSSVPFHKSSIPVLTAFLEPTDTLQSDLRPLPSRKTSASLLTKVVYPQVSSCSLLTESWPIDDFPSDDPFLPWIHSVFPSQDGTSVKVVAQNKRRCHVGDNEKQEMKHWEPQIALLQPIPVTQIDGHYRITSPEKAMWKETRFLCRFHTATQEFTTLSEFPFNYEYVTWRKNEKTMFEMVGKDVKQFWLSQLLFSCPIPNELQILVKTGEHVTNDQSNLWMDLVPIRTPARYGEPLFTSDHVGKDLIKNMKIFNTTREWAEGHVLPSVQDSGRWANIPVCLPPSTPKHRLVACTWTAASYTRRGDAVTMSDTSQRLREWILFHQMVGFEKIYVYDNTAGKESPLREICNEFNICIYQKWPATVCNNNRPNHANPGERSSQYAAEATCRERHGPTTDWMAFIDTDEYLVPMKSDTWGEVLEDMDARGMKILKMKSSRTKPRLDFMEYVTLLFGMVHMEKNLICPYCFVLHFTECHKTSRLVSTQKGLANLSQSLASSHERTKLSCVSTTVNSSSRLVPIDSNEPWYVFIGKSPMCCSHFTAYSPVIRL
jgi:hypothetical protein